MADWGLLARRRGSGGMNAEGQSRWLGGGAGYVASIARLKERDRVLGGAERAVKGEEGGRPVVSAACRGVGEGAMASGHWTVSGRRKKGEQGREGYN